MKGLFAIKVSYEGVFTIKVSYKCGYSITMMEFSTTKG